MTSFNKQSSVTLKILLMRTIFSVSGQPLSRSHLLIACLDTPNWQDRSSCDSPASFLSFCIFSPKVSTQTPEPAAEQGIYVSREMADGFLLYQKRKYLKIAIAIGVMVGSLALSFMLSDISMLLFMLILIAGIVLLLSVKLTDNPYRKLWKEPLLFDKTVKAELNTVYAEKKKFLQLFNLIGIALIALGFLFFPLIVPAELLFADTIALAAGMIAAGIGTFLCIYMSGLVRAYRLLIMNEAYQQKRK